MKNIYIYISGEFHIYMKHLFFKATCFPDICPFAKALFFQTLSFPDIAKLRELRI